MGVFLRTHGEGGLQAAWVQGWHHPGHEHGHLGCGRQPQYGLLFGATVGLLDDVVRRASGLVDGNPAGKRWQHGSPILGFYWLLRELLGSTTDDSDYVYLSDGGHFENLGVYELVRRRCKLIVACDASCDPGHGFRDLHNAIEHCRTDFGAEIVIDDFGPLKPTVDASDATPAPAHFVIGRIRYNPDSPPQDGILIYIKPTLRKGDPQDVLAYAKTNPQFPNDTTANQWFDETHFENYRALGQASGEAAAGAIDGAIRHVLNR